MDRPWLRIVTLWMLGVVAAAQLAKFAVLAPALRERHHLSLPETGLLISLLEVGGATMGLFAGMALGRVGVRRALVTGMMLLAAAGACEAFAGSANGLFAARAAEGFGYLLVVIAAPTLIASVATEDDRGPALALWSTFVSVGMAVGGVVTGLVAAVSGPSGEMLAWACACLTGAAAAMRLPDTSPAPGQVRVPSPAAWLGTLGFGFYTTLVCALTMLLPSYLTDVAGYPLTDASVAVGIASIAALPGSATAIILLKSARLDIGRTLPVGVAATLLSATLCPFVFMPGADRSHLATTGLAFGIVMLTGIAAPLVFARLPAMAEARTADDPRVAAANGLLTQFGAAGALIGPPLGGGVIQMAGWPALGMVLCLLAVCMASLLAAAEALARRAHRRTIQELSAAASPRVP